jgi:hypothetical protein
MPNKIHILMRGKSAGSPHGKLIAQDSRLRSGAKVRLCLVNARHDGKDARWGIQTWEYQVYREEWWLYV